MLNGVSWKAYQENMPGGGTVLPLVDGNGYSLDHNPFVYFYDVTGNPTNAHNVYGIAHIRPDCGFEIRQRRVFQ
jgi:hypothetical protein